ncbi:MAG: SdpI family protein [Acidimicrobiia bacterium]|nr:SdpI family protein [Acidimicrobiia bacterium]
MSSGSWILIGIAFVGAGIGLWVVAERTADGRIGRNRFAGIRLRSTRQSDRAWVAGHRAAKQGTRVAAALMVVTGVGLMAASGSSDIALLLIIVGSALWCGAIVKATMAATRAAKDVSALEN